MNLGEPWGNIRPVNPWRSGEMCPKIEGVAPRDVAQLGSAPALGAGCRRFKSCHPDTFHLLLRPCDSTMLAHLIGLIPIGVEWEFRVQLKHPTVVLFLDTSATDRKSVV